MTLVSRLFSDSFSPLKNQNYRTYISGQAVSLVGTFMQQVAQQWYVWDITRDARWIGIVGACAFVPMLLLGPFTGSIADRVDRRKLLIVTQTAEMLLAFVLGILALTDARQVWPVVVLALALGVCVAFNFPAQGAFIGDLSGMGEIRKAVAFNVTMIETGRLIGPALAGWVVALTGTGIAFMLNGLSFIAVIASLLRVSARQSKRAATGHPLSNFAEALRYMRNTPRIVDLLLCSTLVTLFIFSSLQLSAPIADTILQGGPQLVGYMLAASGAGALLGSLFIAPQIQKMQRAGLALLLALLWSGAWLVAMSFFQWAPLTLLGIFLYSINIPVVLGSVNALTQLLSPDDMRARVLSASQMLMFGAQPLGALMVGWSANAFGPLAAIRINGLLMLALVGLFLALRPAYRQWKVERPPTAH
jgi:MFS family permease